MIITTKEWYTDHLHGIEELHTDVCSGEDDDPLVNGQSILNYQLIAGVPEKSILRDGGMLQRSTRWSLTCRDVIKVVSGASLIGKK